MRKRSLLILPLLCICSLIVFTNALSKSDRKVRKPLEPEPEQEHEDENTARRNVEKAERDFEQMQQKMRRNPQDNSLRGWRPAKIKFDPLTMVTRDRILRDEKSFYIGERVSKLPTLAYITPWNGRGYDLAKWAAKKYTHIAPVWLQILPVDDGETLSCELTGTHDVDHTWIDDVRANNSAIRIVPRVVFENWRPNQLVGLLEQEEWQQACSSMLADYLQRNALDGAVVELWMTVIAMSRRSKIPLLLEMLNSWADKFHKQDLLLITPVPPLSARDGPTGFFTPSDFRALSSVDFVQVMTYDFPGGGAIAPFDWMHKNLFQILNGAPHSAHRLLLGIHHYGYHYAGDNDPVKAVSWDQYLEQLRRPDAELEWDDESAEHYIANGIERIYYPSLSSLEMRLELARKYDIGVAIWELGQGLNYFGQLL